MPPVDGSCYLFAGPTLHAFRGRPLEIPPDVRLLPPARFGDVAALVAAVPVSSLAVADVTSYPDVPVGYAELRAALDAGWSVWGVSAAGAVRAVEMAGLGMRGFGQVHRLYAEAPSLPEDWAACLHAPPPDYHTLSEPMLHLDAALAALEADGLLTGEAREAVSARLRSEWYGGRTCEALRECVAAEAAPEATGNIARFLADLDRFRIQPQDLEDFLRTAPWRHGS